MSLLLGLGLACFGIGIAFGTRGQGLAIAGAVTLIAASIALQVMRRRTTLDGVLTLTSPSTGGVPDVVVSVIRRHCRSFLAASLRRTEEGILEHEYLIAMPDKITQTDLVARLQAISGVKDVSLRFHKAAHPTSTRPSIPTSPPQSPTGWPAEDQPTQSHCACLASNQPGPRRPSA